MAERDQLPIDEPVAPITEKPLPSAVETSDATQEEVIGVKLWTIMSGITLVCFLTLLDMSILATAVPYITSQFHSLSNVGWYGAAYQLGNAIFQPLTGKVYANFHVKWAFLTFFAVFELGSLLCAVSTSSNFLIVGRTVTGIGTSGLQNGAFTIIAGMKPMAKRPALTGICIGVSQLGIVIGPLIGGALTQYTTWRWCFYINLPAGALVALLLVFTHIPEVMVKPRPMDALRSLPTKLDLIGFTLFAPAVIMLLLAIQWGGNTYAWNSSVVIGLLVGAGVNGLVWLGWDWYKKEDALISIPMLQKRNVWSGCLTFGLTLSTMFCASYYLPIYFQAVKGATPTMSGVDLLPTVVTSLLFAIAGGKLVGVVGFYLPFSLIGAVLMATGYGLISTLEPSTSTGMWIGYQILQAAGRGMSMQIPVIAIQHNLPAKDIPSAMALAIFSSTFGGSLCLSFADTIFTNSLRTLISEDAAGVNAAAVIASGASASEVRHIVSGAKLPGVLRAYATSIDRVFYMLAALAAVSFFASFGLGWKDIRQKPPAASKA